MTTEPRRSDSGWVPYVAPYFAFMLAVQFQSPGWFDETIVMPVLQVVLPAALLVYYGRQGAYPDLRGFRFTTLGVAGDVLLGLGIAALWIVPPEMGWLGKPESGFDPERFGAEQAHLVLAFRLVGYAAVTPFMEELFVRSFLLRAAELVHVSRKGVDIDFDADFRDLPTARFAWKGFLATVVLFTFSHLGWQWPVALLTGIVWNLWLYHRGHIVPLVISHATANLAIFVATVSLSGNIAGPDGSLLDLWYQL